MVDLLSGHMHSLTGGHAHDGPPLNFSTPQPKQEMQDAALESKEVSDPDSAEKTNVKGFQFAIVMVAVCFIFAVVGLVRQHG